MTTHRAFTVRPSAPWIVLGFAIIYLVWGSTYLAIRVAIDTLPPLMMTGARFLSAGLILYAIARRRTDTSITASHWRSAAWIGGLMMVGGVGTVSWAEQWVPSGVAALLIVTVPLWIAILEWLGFGGRRPDWGTAVALVAGFAGVALLVGPVGDGQPIDPAGTAAIVLASIGWSFGTLASRTAPAPKNAPLVTTAMRMTAAGVMLLALGMAAGERADIHLASVTTASWLAFGYLIVFGSIVVFSAYYWLLGVVSPTAVATYAYVNPVVAVALGWALRDEPLGWRTVIAAVLIIGAVVLIAARGRRVEGASEPDAIASGRAPDPAPTTTSGDGGLSSSPQSTPQSSPHPVVAPSSRVRQHPERAHYDRATIHAILDAGKVCHVGVVIDGQPMVIPMGYGRDGERLLLHGGRGSRLMQLLGAGAPVCVTVTHLDGLVLARSAMHHSMNYRSVVAVGRGEAITDPVAKRAALDTVIEHLTPGRGAVVRAPDAAEVDATAVVAISLDQASAKVRSGPPKDAARDLGLLVWAGEIPLELVEREAVPDAITTSQRTAGRG